MTEQKTLFRYALAGLLLFIFALAGYVFLVNGTREEEDLLAQTKGVYESEAAREGARLDLRQQLTQVSKESALVSSYFFNKETVDKVLNLLESLGSPLGVVVSTEQVVQNDSDSFVLRLSVRATGSKQNVLQYIAKIERAPYLVDITSVRFDRLGDKADAWAAVLSLAVRGYKTE